MIKEYITEQDILGRPYDPRQEVEKDARHEIDYMFRKYDGKSLKSHLVDLSTDLKMLLRKVLLELIEVLRIGLEEKLRSEGLTEQEHRERADTVRHIASLIRMMPIEPEEHALFADSVGGSLGGVWGELPTRKQIEIGRIQLWLIIHREDG